MIKFKNIVAVCSAVAISSVSAFSAFADDEHQLKEKALDLLFRKFVSEWIDNESSFERSNIKNNEIGISENFVASFEYSTMKEYIYNYCNVNLQDCLNENFYSTNLNTLDSAYVEWAYVEGNSKINVEITDTGDYIIRDDDLNYYTLQDIENGWNVLDSNGNIYKTYYYLTQYAGAFDFSEYLEDNSEDNSEDYPPIEAHAITAPLKQQMMTLTPTIIIIIMMIA